MAQDLRALTTLSEDPGSISCPHIMAHDGLTPVHCPLLASVGQAGIPAVESACYQIRRSKASYII